MNLILNLDLGLLKSITLTFTVLSIILSIHVSTLRSRKKKYVLEILDFYKKGERQAIQEDICTIAFYFSKKSYWNITTCITSPYTRYHTKVTSPP